MPPRNYKQTNTMKKTIETTVDKRKMAVTYDVETMTDYARSILDELGVRSLTYRVKDKLKALGEKLPAVMDFDKLYGMFLAGGGFSIAAVHVDDAVARLQALGAKIPNRPKRKQGQPGSAPSATAWASTIELHPKIVAHYAAIGKEWGYETELVTLASLAAMIEWKALDDARKQQEDLMADAPDFSNLDDEEEEEEEVEEEEEAYEMEDADGNRS